MQDEFSTGFGGDVKQQELPRMGAHQAVCCQVHTLGVQFYNGKPDLNPTGVFVFELEEKLSQGPKAGQPFVISERFSQYMGSTNKHSKLRQFLQSWAGSSEKAKITDEKAKVMNIKKWERFPCTLIIGHVPHKKVAGITVAKLLGIGPRDPAAPVVPVTYTDVPKWITDAKEEARKMAATVGYDPQGQRAEREAAPGVAVPAGGPARAPAAPLAKEDDLPF